MVADSSLGCGAQEMVEPKILSEVRIATHAILLWISGVWTSCFFKGSSRQDAMGGCLKITGELAEQPPHCTRTVHPNVRDGAGHI